MEDPFGLEGQEQHIPYEVFGFFNPDAKIAKLPEGGYSVETVLKDGHVEGGQKVKMILGDEQEIEKVVGTDQNGEKVTAKGYRIRMMKVNGGSFIAEEEEVYMMPFQAHQKYVTPRVDQEEEDRLMAKEGIPKEFPSDLPFWRLSKDMQDKIQKVYSTSVVVLSDFYNSAGAKNGVVLVDSIQKGDHLVVMKHEIGHTRNPTGANTVERIRDDFRNTVTQRYLAQSEGDKKIKPSFKEVQLFLSTLYEEKRASRVALADLRELTGKKHDPFPNDPGLLRVKKFLTTALMTYLQSDPDLEAAIGGKRNSIVNLD